MARIGITGKPTGRLSGELIRRGFIDLAMDITDEHSIAKSLEQHSPDIIINCAAYTNVDKSQSELLTAYKINAVGPNLLAKQFKGRIIHISTDYIFSTDKKPDIIGFKEGDIAIPISSYGHSKYFGEVGLRAFLDRTTIVRTTILYEYNQKKTNFVQSIYDNLKQNKKVSVPEIYGNPTYIPHLADGIISLIENKINPGIINIAGYDNVTRYELALKIAEIFEFNPKLVLKGKPYGDAKREIYAGLILDKAIRMNIPIYTLEQGLNAFKDKINE